MRTAWSRTGTSAEISLFAVGACLVWAILAVLTVSFSWMRRGGPRIPTPLQTWEGHGIAWPVHPAPNLLPRGDPAHRHDRTAGLRGGHFRQQRHQPGPGNDRSE